MSEVAYDDLLDGGYYDNTTPETNSAVNSNTYYDQEQTENNAVYYNNYYVEEKPIVESEKQTAPEQVELTSVPYYYTPKSNTEEESEQYYYNVENTLEVCPDGNECFNGGKCLLLNQNGKTSYQCDCSSISGAVPFVGYGCRFPPTSYCSFYGQNKDSFCTNEGICRKLSMPDITGYVEHLGCDCPAGFKGDFCELHNGESIASNPGVPVEQSGSNVALMVSLITLTSVVSLTAIIFLIRTRSNSKKNTETHTLLEENDNDPEKVDKTRPIE